MERPINSLEVLEEELRSRWENLEAGTGSALDALMSHHHQMPFLQMLRGAMQGGGLKHDQQEEEEEEQVIQAFLPSSSYPVESHSQLLLRLQHQSAECSRAAAVETVDSCVTHASPPNPAAREQRRKRKRARVATPSAKNEEEAESQRMAHIAVERNRRRLMNSHLAALRALMPPSFVQRGDQASIIGGAIEFVKELELRLLSLRAKKLALAAAAASASSCCSSSSCGEASSPRALMALSRCSDYEGEESCSVEGLFVAPQYRGYSQSQYGGVDVEAVVVQGHVGLKVAGRRRPGQLSRAVAALEAIRLHVLHLTVVSLGPSAVLYSLNLKMEQECKLGSPDEIATAVHHIFACINACQLSS